MPAVEPGKFLLFRANRVLMGVELRKTLKVISAENLTVVPRSPEHVKGVVLYEGKATPVFQRPKNDLAADAEKLILLLDHPRGPVGLVIDKIIGVIGENEITLDKDGVLKYEGEILEIAPPEIVVSPVNSETLDR